ncbi:MAG: patatin-like phospholipase family protein [Propionicimonas sp.]|nr:patatin-like phospholipase family protein [Propionicimonas sp.]
MGDRVLCLGAGAVTGAGWQLGVVAGLADEGIDLAAADRVIGTSAGALVGAHLALGHSTGQIAATLLEIEVDGRLLRPSTLARLGVAQVWPSRRHAVVWLGRSATGSGWTPARGADWAIRLGAGLAGQGWPEGLVVVATDVASGRPAYFTDATGVELETAVAASCALPGVFPPVVIEGRAHFDGALRSLVNLDLAEGADVVVAVAPFSASARSHRRPREQARQLGATTVLLLEPDAGSRRAIGLDPVASGRSRRALEAGRAFGRSQAARVGAAWRQRG